MGFNESAITYKFIILDTSSLIYHSNVELATGYIQILGLHTL